MGYPHYEAGKIRYLRDLRMNLNFIDREVDGTNPIRVMKSS
jgi:hypothetical protein